MANGTILRIDQCESGIDCRKVANRGVKRREMSRERTSHGPKLDPPVRLAARDTSGHTTVAREGICLVPGTPSQGLKDRRLNGRNIILFSKP